MRELPVLIPLLANREGVDLQERARVRPQLEGQKSNASRICRSSFYRRQYRPTAGIDSCVIVRMAAEFFAFTAAM